MAIQTTYSDTPEAAFAGQLIYGDLIVPMTNDEASAEIAFGLAVVLDPSSPATDQSATLPTAETNKVWGIVLHSNAYDRTYTLADGSTGGELGTTGLMPGAVMNVLRKGRVWVTAQTAVTPGDRLWVRAVATGDEVLGGLEDADDGTDMIDCTSQGVWCTTAAAGDLAILEVDFTNKP